jgi:hypothetical protein
MKNSGRCGISKSICLSAPSLWRAYIGATRAFCDELIRKPVSVMPSGAKIFSLK